MVLCCCDANRESNANHVDKVAKSLHPSKAKVTASRVMLALKTVEEFSQDAKLTIHVKSMLLWFKNMIK